MLCRIAHRHESSFHQRKYDTRNQNKLNHQTGQTGYKISGCPCCQGIASRRKDQRSKQTGDHTTDHQTAYKADVQIHINFSGAHKFHKQTAEQTIRTKLGKAIKVTSGYRCVKHNADPKVGGSRTSRHLYGIAADWRTKDRSVNPVALGIIAAAQGFGAVGIYWHDKAAIVHTDTRGGKATWLCVQPGVYPSTTYNKFVLPTIEQGCEGAANRAATVMLQRLLGIPHDGSFGPATTKALMAAQRKHGLTPDGICGPKSWTVLSGADKYL